MKALTFISELFELEEVLCVVAHVDDVALAVVLRRQEELDEDSLSSWTLHVHPYVESFVIQTCVLC